MALIQTETSMFISQVGFYESLIYISFIRVRITILGPGTSRNPCSEIYAGPRAFSEPETKALADFISTFDNVKMYLAFHSYGQYILYPYVSKIAAS